LSDLDPELYRTILVRAKRQLRQRLRALRSAIPAEALALRNRLLCERVKAADWFERAQSVALFWPMLSRHEVDLRPIDDAARALGKRIFYPFMADEGETVRTGFRWVADVQDMRESPRGFLEPPPSAPEAAAGELDLVLVPALGATPAGDRLGYGAGFYDVTLPEFCPPARSVVVVFDFQMLGELPVSELDFACDAVVTDNRVFEARG
jgi:5-formyltetrahydrofolate cyclo-ligase